MFVLLILSACCCASGFVFDSDSQGTAGPDTSHDTQYLHLLLMDEKTERMRLQKEFDQFKAAMIQEVTQLKEQDELGGVLHLKKNNQTIEYVFAGYNAGWDMGGASTVARLTKGDDVWVEGRDYIGGGNGNDAIGPMLHTGISGTLLHSF